MRSILLVLLLGAVASAQSLPLGGIPTGGGGGGGGGITQVGTCSDATCIGGNSETGASSDHQHVTSGTLTVPGGTTLLIATCAGAPTSWVVSDSLGNTWHVNNATDTVVIAYAFDKGGSALATGADAFTCDSGTTTGFPSNTFTAWNGTLTTASVLDVFGDYQTSSLTCTQTTTGGTMTFATTQANELLVCASLEGINSGPYTISGTESYATLATIVFSSGVNYGSGLASKIQAASGAVGTGVWSGTTSGATTTVAGAFKHP